MAVAAYARGRTVMDMRTLSTLAFLALAGCSTPNPATEGGTGSEGGTASGGPSYACADLLRCAAKCPDDPCTQACIDRSTESAKQKVANLLACAKNNCPDGGDACFEASCAAEITACVDDVASRDGGTTPAAMPLLQDLVGVWKSSDATEGTSDTYTFKANGTYTLEHSYVPPNGCTSNQVIEKLDRVDTGVANVQNGVLSTTPEETLQQSTMCINHMTSAKKYVGVGSFFNIVIMGTTMTLTEQVTDAKTVTFTKQ